MTAPRVTVLMAAYNAERFLAEAVASVLGQSFQDFEFLIVDDGSTDGTPTMLRALDDPRVRILTNPANVGLAGSLNRGLAEARGEVLARMDADDLSAPRRLELQLAHLDAHGDVGLLGTAWVSVDDRGREVARERAYSGWDAVHFFCGASAMVRRSCLDRVGGYRGALKYAEDYDLYLRLREICGVAGLDETLYQVRIHPASVSRANRGEQELDASLALDLAEERRRLGRDRLADASPEQAREVRRAKQGLEGAALRAALADLYLTWGDAARSLGLHGRAVSYARASMRLRTSLHCLRLLAGSSVKAWLRS